MTTVSYDADHETARRGDAEPPSTDGAPLQRRAAQARAAHAQSDAVLQRIRSLQRHGDGEDTATVHAAAARGTAGAGGPLPHIEAIQRAFGPHDVSRVQAHVGGQAAEASAAMGAQAYATGNDIAFAQSPDLHTAAHEAAHVVQQRGGVQLEGGVGQVGDPYERHADAVADRVVQGESAVDLLDQMSGSSASSAVQSKAATGSEAAPGTDASDVMADAERVVALLEAIIAEAADSDEASATPSAEGPAEASTSAPQAAPTVGEEANPAPRPELEQARDTLTRFTDLMAAGESDELRAATEALLGALEGGVADSGAAAQSRAGSSAPRGAPVQRTAAVAGAPLVAAGPIGWVALGLLAIGTLAVGGYVYSRRRTTTTTKAEPVPATRTNDRRRPKHRGRLQVQGGGIELSYPWARAFPMSKAEATAALLSLKAQLSRRELALRDQAFTRALAFIARTVTTAPPPVSMTFQNRSLPANRRDRRVDIEIRTGTAFV